tara:strand:+ start:1036 stop:1392 length:357 start_codon:yes stop_codon:yes gene_type:complete
MSKRTYQENLEDKGLSKTDGSYDVATAVERAHEAFTLLSDEHRVIIQDMWGIKFVTQLERFGRYTDKQSNLVQAPAIMFRDLTNKEEQEFEIMPERSMSLDHLLMRYGIRTIKMNVNV